MIYNLPISFFYLREIILPVSLDHFPGYGTHLGLVYNVIGYSKSSSNSGPRMSSVCETKSFKSMLGSDSVQVVVYAMIKVAFM